MRMILILAALAGTGCLVDMPALVRMQRVKTEIVAPDFTVIANPEGATGWRVDVRNNTDAVATIVWDESTFVSSGGSSAGRLVSGSTMKIDVTRAHPPTPVAPHANASELVFPEGFVADMLIRLAPLTGRSAVVRIGVGTRHAATRT